MDIASDLDGSTPVALKQQCIEFLIEHFNECIPAHYSFYLSASVCDEVFHKLLRKYSSSDGQWMDIFCDVSLTELRKLDLEGTDINDSTLCKLLKHKLIEVNVRDCANVCHEETMVRINENGLHLQRLSLDHDSALVSGLLPDLVGLFPKLKDGLNLPRLRSLVFTPGNDIAKRRDSRETVLILERLISTIHTIVHLDLSNFPASVPDHLILLPNLHSLILYNVVLQEDDFCTLHKIKTLRLLDLSNGKEVKYESPDNHLRNIVCELNNLKWLDLSGTNLPCLMFVQSKRDKKEMKEEEKGSGEPDSGYLIRGLEGRYFEYLGLFKCGYVSDASSYIPAHKVSGTKDDEQVLTACEVFLGRPDMFVQAIERLMFLIRREYLSQKERCLKMILNCIEMKDFSTHHRYGIACLYELMKNNPPSMSYQLKRSFILNLLEIMEENEKDSHIDTHKQQMMMKACICLTRFELPEDFLFVYCRLIRLLTNILNCVCPLNVHPNYHRIALAILKKLSSQVDIEFKDKAGQLGVVHVMLRFIQTGTDGDEFLRAWSVLWSLTDMSHSNSRRFVEENGINILLHCLKISADPDPLRRKAAGLMCNVAEVPDLRPILLDAQFLNVFIGLLDNEDIDISNGACGVLCLIMGDGKQAWTVDGTDRNQVLQKMSAVIQSWDVTTTHRNVRYRSFQPMLSLFTCFETPTVQHWAVWEVCNMMGKNAPRYSQILRSEGGIELMEQLLADSRTSPAVHDLLLRCQDLNNV